MKIPADLLTAPERKAYRRGHTDALTTSRAKKSRQNTVAAAARSESLTPERRAEIARKAAAKRWGAARRSPA